MIEIVSNPTRFESFVFNYEACVFAEFYDNLHKDGLPQTRCGQTVRARAHSAHSHGGQT